MTVYTEPAAPAGSASLSFRRLTAAGAGHLPQLLGGRWLGAASSALQVPLLAPGTALFDAWLGTGELSSRQLGCVRYVSDGCWLHGCAEIADDGNDMQATARRAYADVFSALADSQCPHLLRVWNYFADMNRESGGIERYRQFNAGRQQAFIDAQRNAFEGSPAACALGTRGGPLQVYFLAGRTPPRAIENPRQLSAYRYPETYGSRPPTFSRAALAEVGDARTALFISGTASIVGHLSMHPGDVRRQAQESLANIAAVREAAEARAALAFPADELVYTLYLRHAEDLAAVREVFEQAVGPASSAAREAVYVNADVCRAELLVEIEAHGFARSRV